MGTRMPISMSMWVRANQSGALHPCNSGIASDDTSPESTGNRTAATPRRPVEEATVFLDEGMIELMSTGRHTANWPRWLISIAMPASLLRIMHLVQPDLAA